jgi:hypothetical protein
LLAYGHSVSTGWSWSETEVERGEVAKAVQER